MHTPQRRTSRRSSMPTSSPVPTSRDRPISLTPSRRKRRQSFASAGSPRVGRERSAGNTHVVVRVRPMTRAQKDRGMTFALQIQDNCVMVNEDNSFTFDRVFEPTSTQEDVFEEIGKPLIQKVFEGYNGTVLAYGQTASGKTHTMQGPDIRDPLLAGVIPRIVMKLFQSIAEAPENKEFIVRASYVEIYLERVRDLLHPAKSNLSIREDPKKGIYVEGMSEVYVASVEQVMDLVVLGSINRSKAATGMNEGSSRSHSVFMLQVVQKDISTGSTVTSKVNLVDLAGSEMIRKTRAEAERLDEAKMINKSLSALGNVINALTDGRSTHVPYRDSKLTRMLQESLGGNARTWLIINVCASSDNTLETISTLRFGNRAKNIQNKAIVNQVRTVEELEGLLQKAEVALDVQARYIEKLQKQSLEQQLQSPKTGKEAQKKTEDGMDEATRRGIELEKAVETLQERLTSEKEELERSNMEIQILNTNLRRLEQENKENCEKRKSAEESARSLERDLHATQFELKASNISLNTVNQDCDRLHKELERLEKQRTNSVSEPQRKGSNRHYDITVGEAKNDEIHEPISTCLTPQESSRKHEQRKTMRRPDKTPNLQYMSSLEQRLNQLVNAHRQLLRKYASLELANGELYALLCLKDEQIKQYEDQHSTNDGEDRRTIQELEQRIELLREEKLTEIEQLKEKLTGYGSNSGSQRASLSPHSGTINIVQPLRGQKTQRENSFAQALEELPPPPNMLSTP